MACLRLVTRFLDRPERSWPRFISCIAFSTFSDASRPYLRRRRVVRLLVTFTSHGPSGHAFERARNAPGCGADAEARFPERAL
jgi:hypothetical protein